MKFVILIPAYNAADYLPNLFAEIKKLQLMHNLFVINDGSTDMTTNICHNYDVKVFELKKNQGKGAALRKGFEILKKQSLDFIITMDADLQHPPDLIPFLISKYQETKADIIIGNRLHKKSNMPKDRLLSNKITTWLISLLCKRKVWDSQCGYRLVTMSTINNLNLISNRYEIETEILVKAIRNGATINNIPMDAIYGTEKSSIHRIWDTYRFIKTFFRLLLIK